MNFKTTIILIVLLILVGGGVWLSERGGAPEVAPEQPMGAEGRKLLDISASHVTRLSITDAASKQTSVERSGGQWQMISPVNAPAVDFSVRDLVGQIAEIRSHGRPSTDPGSESGLDKPRYRIEIATDDGKTTKLLIGNKTGIGDQMYARVNDGDINLVDVTLEKPLKTAADELRDKHLFTIKDPQIKEFRIVADGKTLSAANVEGKWQILEPQKLPGDSAAISSMLASLTSLTATEYVKSDSPDLALARFNRPTTRVWLSSDAPTTQPATTLPSNPTTGVTLLVGAPDSLSKEHYFVKLSDGQTAKIAGNLMDAFKRTPLDLRDKDMATIPTTDVNRVSIVEQTYAPPATQPAVQAASTQPATTQIAAATPPAKQISSQTIVLSKRPPAKPQPLGPALPAATTMGSTTQPTTLVSTAPSTEPVEEPSIWVLDGESAKPAEDSKVSTLLASFQPLRAERYLEKAPDAPPAKHFLLTITTAPAGGKGEVSYDLDVIKFAADPSKPDAAKPVATYNGLVFELPSALVDAIEADFHKGSKPAPAPARPTLPPGFNMGQ